MANAASHYRVGHKRSRPFKRLGVIAIVLALVLASVGYVVARQYLKPNTVLKQDRALVSVYGANEEKHQHITTPDYSFDLPDNWEPVKLPPTLYGMARWHGTSTDDSPRLLDIYIDKLPRNLPLNRMLPVEAQGTKITLLNTVSDNCTSFTDGKNEATGSTSAKWSGVNFMCDTGNTLRNVTGTGSTEGINVVTLKGSHGSRPLFFVYTDNSSSPDYRIFTEMLSSFRLN
jgi:hypothetical protein